MKPEKQIRDYLSLLGRRGGQTTSKKYGNDFFSKIGRIGGIKTQQSKKKCIIDEVRRCRKNGLKYLSGSVCPCYL